MHIIILKAIILCCILLMPPTASAVAETLTYPPYIKWLEKQSMLFNSNILSNKISASAILWRRPYARPQPETIDALAPNWLQLYPAAIIVKPEQSMLQLFSNPEFWKILNDLDINVLHVGPLGKAGEIIQYQYKPTADGWFDPIELTIDPLFGTEDQYKIMASNAAAYNIMLAGDVIPGHTGRGADFLLAEYNYKYYPGIYDMVPIDKDDWYLLPEVTDRWQTSNLTPAQVAALTKKGYIPGALQRVLFTVPYAKVKVTGWDATAPIVGVDGITRRWVYLHYFKPEQPTMDWLDPSFGAERIVAAQIIAHVNLHKNKIIRIDANQYLGIEPRTNSLTSWSEQHPLTIVATNEIAWLTRKLGGWSYQEFNAALEDLSATANYGPDLSYDFVTRPAVEHAALTGDAAFLRLMFHLMHKHNIEPNQLVHDMQNHDDLTYELPYFALHPQDKFLYKGQNITGKELHATLLAQMRKIALGININYEQEGGNGLCTTFAGLIAARLNVVDIYKLTPEQKQKIKNIHLLLAMFNALQPGIFSISGWDLVGALPLRSEQTEHFSADHDCRWLNRGAYDLLGDATESTTSFYTIPKAETIYGPIPKQLHDHDSFVNHIIELMKIRKKYHIANAKLLEVPEVKNTGAVILLNQLPNNGGLEITAINFSDTIADEEIDLHKFIPSTTPPKEVLDLLTHKVEPYISLESTMKIHLNPLQGKALLIR